MSDGYLIPYIALLALSAAYLIAYGAHCLSGAKKAAAASCVLLALFPVSLGVIFVFILLRSFG